MDAHLEGMEFLFGLFELFGAHSIPLFARCLHQCPPKFLEGGVVGYKCGLAGNGSQTRHNDHTAQPDSRVSTLDSRLFWSFLRKKSINLGTENTVYGPTLFIFAVYIQILIGSGRRALLGKFLCPQAT